MTKRSNMKAHFQRAGAGGSPAAEIIGITLPICKLKALPALQKMIF